MLGCRYHGWSYDTKGNLIKAPEFENLPEFDKKLNGLWEVHIEIKSGLVFVNFDTGRKLMPLNLSQRLDSDNKRLTNMRWVADWKAAGAMSWKLAGKSDATLKDLFLMNLAEILVNGASKRPQSLLERMLRILFPVHQQLETICHTGLIRYLPSGLVLALQILPLSTKSTEIECSLYSTSYAKQPVAPERIDAIKQSILTEIESIEITQKRLLKHGYSSGKRKISSIYLSSLIIGK